MSQRDRFRQGAGGRMQAGGGKMETQQNRQNQKSNPYPTGNKKKCPDCNFITASDQSLRAHFQRTNHGDGQGNIPDHIRRSLVSLKDYIYRQDREPLIGLEYVLEYRLQHKQNRVETRYFCYTCDVEADLVTMAEHLCTVGHRKRYLAKEYPYVLKAPSCKDEDRAQFVRRMAMEIEREEGTKALKTEPGVRLSTVMSAKSIEAKQSNQAMRWDEVGDKQRRIRKSLEYLESFEIDNDSEASTVTRLTDKLTAELKYYSDKLKEEALFPEKVARAKDVAMSIMQQASKGKTAQQNPVHKVSPIFNKEQPENTNMRSNVGMSGGPPQPNVGNPYWTPNPALPPRPQEFPLNQKHRNQLNQKQPENTNMRSNVGMPGGPPQPNVGNPYSTPNPAFPPRPQEFPVNQKPNHPMPGAQEFPINQKPNHRIPGAQEFPLNQKPNHPMAGAQEFPLNQKPNYPMPGAPDITQSGQSAGSNPEPKTDENAKFLKKLTSLLSALPQRNAPTDNSNMNSKLQVLKSLLQNKTTDVENTQANQLPMQAPSAQDMAGMGNVSLNQQMDMMASRNLEPVGRVNQNVSMQMASMGNNAIPGENAPPNQNSLMRIAELLQNSQMNANSFLTENQNIQNQEFMQMDNSSMMLMDQSAYLRPHREQPYADMSYESGVYSGEWNESSNGNFSRNREFGDYTDEQTPYTDRYDRNLRRDLRSHGTRFDYDGRRPFDDPEWAEREGDMYSESAKLDSDERILTESRDQREDHPDESGSLGSNNAALSVDLLKRIRGKDLFTVSAILNEYRESHPE